MPLPGGVERIMACSNGYISFAPIQEEHWQRLLEMIGGPELAQDERFKDAAGRREHGEELTRVVESWTRQHTKEEVADLIQGADFPGVPVQDVNEAVNWDHFAAREFFVDIDHPKVGKLRYPRGPYMFSNTPWSAFRPAPLLGQHNEEIYCGRLGYSKQELARLRAAGVI
jgi:crotonobetainyl-CoA:carnitine CoA-transferase CaiB-like acyl-CoA transferase